MRIFLALLPAALFLTMPLGASIVFSTGTGSCLVVPNADCENVLFSIGSMGDPLFGTTNQTETDVSFQSTDGTLQGEASGQSRVSLVSGTFTNLTITTDPFIEMLLNVNWDRPSGPNAPVVTATLSAFDTMGTEFVSDPFTLSNGQNRYRVLAQDDQFIASVTVNTTGGIADVRQVRLGGFEEDGGGGGGGTPIPEPMSLLLLGSGLALGLLVKSRSQARF